MTHDELRELAARATPGPWHAYFTTHGDPFVVCDRDRWPQTQMAQVSTAPDDYGRANCEFIAAARTALPALLDTVDRLQQQANAVRALHERVPDGHGGWCRTCQTPKDYWPCSTIAALGDDAPPP